MKDLIFTDNIYKVKRNKAKSEGKHMETNTDNFAENMSQETQNTENASVNDVFEQDSQAQQDFSAIKSELEAQVAEYKDKYLRLSAEFDNYRRRTLKEKMDLTKFAGEDLLKSLLPIVDDFERGLKNIEQASDIEAVKEGVFLIYGKFTNFLNQKGLKEIEALNSEFNTDFHEAITKVPVEDKEKSGKIIDVVQKGYTLEDRVVRYAKVVVGE